MSIQENLEIDIRGYEHQTLLREHAGAIGVSLEPLEELSILGMLNGRQAPLLSRDDQLRGDIMLARPSEPPTREFVLKGLFRAVQDITEAERRQRRLMESDEQLQEALRLLASS